MKNIAVFFAFFAISVQAAVAQRPINPTLAALRDEKDSITLQKRLIELGNSDKEEDLGLVLQFYNMQRNNPKADSIFRMAQKKFPKGQYAFTAAGNKVTLEEALTKKEKLYKKLIKEFPGRNYSMQQYGLAYAYAQAGNKKGMLKYANQISDKSFQLQAFVILGEQLLQQGDLNTAESLVRIALDSTRNRMLSFDPATAGNTGVGPQGPMGNPTATYYRYANTYSKILFKMGKVDEAFRYSKEAYDNSNKKNPELNEQYLSLLLATNQMKEALPLMEDAIREGRASVEVKSRLIDAYKTVKGSDDGFVSYREGLEKELTEKVKAAVSKMIINEPAVDFALTDVDGKIVALHDLKGKVVILDFWATWCAPCKKSFPAMQMAVNKYKNDPDVKFLFIHTWERGSAEPAADAKKYVIDNNYSFEVLMDKKDPQTSINKVVTDYKITGIPAKFVIDGDGNIRFKLTGFSGGNDAAVEELSVMIELAKAK